jgi:hypothetical protein
MAPFKLLARSLGEQGDCAGASLRAKRAHGWSGDMNGLSFDKA